MTNKPLTESQELSTEDEREIVEDERKFGFALIDYLFITSGFDSYTQAVYLRIVMRAHGSVRGFDENISTTSKSMGISTRQIKYCRSLLQFCNIIKIVQRFDANRFNKQISSKITLVDKSKWLLDHPHRNALKFSKSEENKKNVQNSKKLKSPKKNKNSGVHSMHGGGAQYARGGVHSMHTEQEPDPNKNPLNNVCEEKPKTSTHTQLKKTEYKCKEIDGVPTAFCISVSKTLCGLFNQSHIDNAGCAHIIRKVLDEAACSISDLREIVSDLPDHPFDAIFSSKRYNLKKCTADLVRWVLERDKALEEYKAKLEAKERAKEAKNANLKASMEGAYDGKTKDEKVEERVWFDTVLPLLKTDAIRKRVQDTFDKSSFMVKGSFFKELTSPLTQEKVDRWAQKFLN